MINDTVINDKNKIADTFNTYFATIGTKMAESITYDEDKTPNDYFNSQHDSKLTFNPIDVTTTVDIIRNLNTKHSSGHDGFSTYMLKKLNIPLSESLTYIINCSLKSGIFPDKIKLAKIIPIYKKDDKSHLGNYRPISLLPAISKLLEKVAYKQLITGTYFTTNNFLLDMQYG